MDTLNLSRYKRWVILTGAGVSAASGLTTWRGPDAMSDARTLQQLCSTETLARDPLAVWQFFGDLRAKAMAAMPNRAHLALAHLEANMQPDQSFLLVTQNIDGLHQRAGSRNVIEFHGNTSVTRCTHCDLQPRPDPHPCMDHVPLCPQCGHPLRPDVVLFGEQIPAFADWAAKRALRDCELLLVVGTSGHVAPAANFARSARYAGAHTILLNLDPPINGASFDQIVIGKAEEYLPKWFGMG